MVHARLLQYVEGTIRFPLPVSKAGARNSAVVLASAGGTGISLTFLFGTTECNSYFFTLSVALLIDAALFALAWLKESQSMVAGLSRRVLGT